MFNFLTTLTNALEHSTVKKVFGSYKNAAIVEGNINLLHRLQDEKLCNSRFIEPEENVFTLDMLLGDREPIQPEEKKPEDMKDAFIKWFNSLGNDDKQFIKDAIK